MMNVTTLLIIIQAIEDQFPQTNVHGEFIHKIHTQRFNLNDLHLQLLYSTNDTDLCDVAVSNEGKVLQRLYVECCE